MNLHHCLNSLIVSAVLCTSLSVSAADLAQRDALVTQPTAPLACPTDGKRLAEGTTACCEGHKGVCGCRAGKIVCCDNTKSASCTCHGDEGVETN